MLGLGLGLALGLGLRLGFKPSSPIVRELVLSLTRLSFPLVRFRHNHGNAAVDANYYYCCCCCCCCCCCYDDYDFIMSTLYSYCACRHQIISN